MCCIVHSSTIRTLTGDDQISLVALLVLYRTEKYHKRNAQSTAPVQSRLGTALAVAARAESNQKAGNGMMKAEALMKEEKTDISGSQSRLALYRHVFQGAAFSLGFRSAGCYQQAL